MNWFKSILFIGVFILSSQTVHAQLFDKIVEFLTVHPNKKAVARDSSIYPSKAIFTPVVSYAPETNLSFGLGMKGLFKMRNSGPETRTSNIPLTLQYTIENKYLFFSGFDIFFPQERYMLTGNVRVQSFPSLYFGIGPNSPKSNEEKFSYSQILLEPIFLKNVFRKYLFAGAGIRYNKIGRVEPFPNGLLDESTHPGSHGSTSTGMQFALIYDSRDNILNAKNGLYIRFTHGMYGEVLGGTQKFQLTRFDMRCYTQPFKKSSTTLAFQLFGHFSNGDTPLLELGRLGGGELMRGYFGGRYTDRHLIVTQFEWRQKITKLWGLVLFAGLGEVAPSVNDFNFDNVRASVGLGARFLIDQKEDLNLRLDFGFGNEKSNYYFKIAEAF